MNCNCKKELAKPDQVPLTYDVVKSIWLATPDDPASVRGAVYFARAIEAAHGITGGKP
jgi:hypothetical protein